MLWMYQRVIFGPLNNDENKKLTDLSSREVLVFAPLVALMLIMGLYPKPFLDRMEKSVVATLERAETKRVADETRIRQELLIRSAQAAAVKADDRVTVQP